MTHALAPVVLGVASALAYAAQPGTLWRLTTSFTGGRMALPARTTESCATGSEAEQSQPAPPKSQNGCEYVQTKRVGNRISYSMKCPRMTGTGEITYGDGHYEGVFSMQTGQGPMRVTLQGERLGSCDAGQPAATSAPDAAPGAASIAGAAGTADMAAYAAQMRAQAQAQAAAAMQSSQAQQASQDAPAAASGSAATGTSPPASDSPPQSAKKKARDALRGLLGH